MGYLSHAQAGQGLPTHLVAASVGGDQLTIEAANPEPLRCTLEWKHQLFQP